ncbi:MAG: Gfo/Idh/MocA family protein [Thermoguttaceae bacterium]
MNSTSKNSRTVPVASKTEQRRRWLKVAACAAGATMVPLPLSSRVLGREGNVAPSNRIVLGAIGINGRGTHDLGVFMKQPVVQFVAITDIRVDRRAAIKKMADDKYNNTDCAMYKDMEEMLERPDIEAVLIATGDRWHTMASIIAAKYGKDIYCEKPLSLTIQESRALADTMKRYGRVYQAGTQRRNIKNFQIAAEMAHTGMLGELKEVHANTLHPATTHDWRPAQPQPEVNEVDWDRWLGPCPWRPYNYSYVTGGWRGFFDFHGGGILEWGTHTVDLCQWANQSDDTVPVEYWPVLDDNGNKGSTCEAMYANGVKLVMREHGWNGLGTCSAKYVGTEGWVETGDTGRMLVSNDRLRAKAKYIPMAGTDPDNHIAEFLECVRSRRNPASNGDVAANAHNACHAAYISWQLGERLKFDPKKEEFVGTGSVVEQANRMRSRAMREPYNL